MRKIYIMDYAYDTKITIKDIINNPNVWNNFSLRCRSIIDLKTHHLYDNFETALKCAPGGVSAVRILEYSLNEDQLVSLVVTSRIEVIPSNSRYYLFNKSSPNRLKEIKLKAFL